ncbi:MAG TPA: type II toxin-antitoxin system RelE/ParE family toxin [bacterium]
MRVLWTDPAADTFRRLSGQVREAVLSRIKMISEFPEMHPVRRHEPYAGLRFFLVEPYCISYAFAEDTIIVLAIFPARRGN